MDTYTPNVRVADEQSEMITPLRGPEPQIMTRVSFAAEDEGGGSQANTQREVDEYADTEPTTPRHGKKKTKKNRQMAQDLIWEEDDTLGGIANSTKVRGEKLTKKKKNKKNKNVDLSTDAYDMQATQPQVHKQDWPQQEYYDDPNDYGDEYEGEVGGDQGDAYYEDDRYGDDPRDGGGGGGHYAGDYDEQVYEDATHIKSQKADLLHKISRLNTNGAVGPMENLSLKTDLDTLQFEHQRMMEELNSSNSVKFQRRALMSVCSVLEYLNEEHKPFEGVELKGWSETVMANIGEYDTVFLQLYEKYKNKVQVQPEIQLMLMVGGSALMFSLSQQMVKNNMPNMKADPRVMEQLVKAMQESAGKRDHEPPPGSSARDAQEAERQGGGGTGGETGGGGEYKMKMPPMGNFAMGLGNLGGGSQLTGSAGNFPPGMGNVDYDALPELVNEFPPPPREDDERSMASVSSMGTSKVIKISGGGGRKKK